MSLILLLACTPASSFKDTSLVDGEGDLVTISTTLGDFVIDLAIDEAPVTATNFLAYVDEGFYDGSDGGDPTVFHRVIDGFMVQGGGLTEDLANKAARGPIINESGNGLLNLRRTVAMARTQDPDSATSQFFVNHLDNDFLDGDSRTGYAVFGEVVDGMDTIDLIAQVPTSTQNGMEDVPVEPVVITGASR